jgi:hypothetical protein
MVADFRERGIEVLVAEVSGSALAWLLILTQKF